MLENDKSCLLNSPTVSIAIATPFAIDELKTLSKAKQDPGLTSLIDLLGKSLDNLKLRELSADDLFKELNKTALVNGMPEITEQVWKTWQKDILQSTRVSRR